MKGAAVFPYALVSGMSLFLVLAVWFDHRARRIPNALVMTGIIAALLLNSGLAEGRGLGASLLGMLFGLALFLPFYFFKVVGAGDAKLVAMVGAFIGHQEIVATVLAILVAGGGLAVVRMAVNGSGRRVMANLKLINLNWWARAQSTTGPEFVAMRDSADKMPYAYAIAVGSLGYQWLHNAAGV